MDHEEDQLECRRGQGNVTKSMDSFESKAVEREASRTPMNPTIIVASSRPQLTMTVGVPPDPLDSVTLVPVRPTSGTTLCPSTCTHQADGGGKLGGNLDLSGRTKRTI